MEGCNVPRILPCFLQLGWGERRNHSHSAACRLLATGFITYLEALSLFYGAFFVLSKPIERYTQRTVWIMGFFPPVFKGRPLSAGNGTSTGGSPAFSAATPFVVVVGLSVWLSVRQHGYIRAPWCYNATTQPQLKTLKSSLCTKTCSAGEGGGFPTLSKWG